MFVILCRNEKTGNNWYRIWASRDGLRTAAYLKIATENDLFGLEKGEKPHREYKMIFDPNETVPTREEEK